MSELKRYTMYQAEFDEPARKVDHYLCSDVDKRIAELEGLLREADSALKEVYPLGSPTLCKRIRKALESLLI